MLSFVACCCCPDLALFSLCGVLVRRLFMGGVDEVVAESVTIGNHNFGDHAATIPFQYGLTFIGWGADKLFEDWGADDLLLYEPFFGGGFGGGGGGGGGGGVSIERLCVYDLDFK